MTALRRAIHAQDWAKGAPNAPHTLLEYGDFECPYCGRAYGELKRLEEAMGDSLRFVFRYFPLAESHPHAMIAAEAAEAAGAQGKFWEMHDLLFENQDRLEADDLMKYAAELGLELQRFSQDIQNHRYYPRVRRDFLEGIRSGVNGTPTFFIDGERYQGAHTFEALVSALGGPSERDATSNT